MVARRSRTHVGDRRNAVGPTFDDWLRDFGADSSDSPSESVSDAGDATEAASHESDFFDEQEDQSWVKSAILLSYFAAWSSVMLTRPNVDCIRYVDLFSGPGRYRSGELSTPLRVVKKTVNDPRLRRGAELIFNDGNSTYIEQLEHDIVHWPRIDTLRFRPRLSARPVDESLLEELATTVSVPTLSFIDPWGYKGLSRHLIHMLIQDWGCEALVFFNYNRINPAVQNEIVEYHMAALFGQDRVAALREHLRSCGPKQREAAILRAIGDSLAELGGSYLIPFRFARRGGRTSHYLVFVTKHRLGYGIMKDIMARAGVVDTDGVPRFAYLPDGRGTQLGFDQERPIRLLADDLASRYAARTVRFSELFDEHNVGTPFVKKNYRDVLLTMEDAGRLSVRSDKGARRRGTFADHLWVTFSA